MGVTPLPGRLSSLRHLCGKPEGRLHAARTGFVMAGNIERRAVVR